MTDLWYSNAVIYAVDVKTFLDSDGDGTGDFNGMIARLDYLANLGVSCLWLLPFFPSPFQDYGYDITDHYGVEPQIGTPGLFVEFVREARERGMRVMVDLVANHTSVKHPWFQSARSDPNSIYRDFYIWSKEKPDTDKKPIVFSEKDASVWEYDEQADAYYYHTFYPYQADLNVANPQVRAELCRIMGYWLQLGVSGFRVDAAPHLIAPKGDAKLDDPHQVLRDLRHFATTRQGDVVLLAETDVVPERLEDFFGNGDQMHMLFNFLLDNLLFLALAREEAEPLQRALKLLPERPMSSQWANFVRNIDELDLERLSDEERQEVFEAFAPDEDMRVYGRGIRRRLAPMLDGDQRKLRLTYSLLFTLPGTPVIVYGDEIGMGDDLSLPERWAVRTPMQWSHRPNGGFSAAAADKLIRPVVTDGPFSHEHVNVEAQELDEGSLLHWMRHAIRTRRMNPAFGRGRYTVLDTGQAGVLAVRSEWEGSVLVAVHNLSAEPVEVTLDLPEEEAKELFELLGDERYDPPGDAEVRLNPYGYRWLRVGEAHDAPYGERSP